MDDDDNFGGGEAPLVEEPKERRRVRAAKDAGKEKENDDTAYNPSAGASEKKRSAADGSAGSAGGSSAGSNLLGTAMIVRDKLQLLGYTSTFCSTYGLKPISPLYFAVPASNGLDQLNYLALLVHWLCEEAGHVFLKPDAFNDDPNAIAATLLQQVKKLGKFSADVPPAKVKAAHGEGVLNILNGLCDAALDACHFTFEKSIQPADSTSAGDRADEIEDEAAEGALLDNGENAQGLGDDDDMEEPLLESSLGGIATGTPVKPEDPSRAKQREILESKVNPAAWKLELERVAPMLKVTVASNELREWRSRLEQLTTFIAFARDNFPESKANLAKISADVKQVLEKLASRERYFQSQLEHHISDYRQVMERNNEVSERHREASDKVNAATTELSNITDDLETIKSQMQDRGESYTDATPVQAIKTSIANIKEEIAQFDVRVAVLQQNLLQVRMKAQDEANRARKKAAQGARPAKV